MVTLNWQGKGLYLPTIDMEWGADRNHWAKKRHDGPPGLSHDHLVMLLLRDGDFSVV